MNLSLNKKTDIITDTDKQSGSATNSIMQIIVVLTTMIGVKSIADYFQITGAGSIGMWVGIILATWFMKRQNIEWSGFGLILPKGKREWFKQIGLALLAVVSVFLIMGLVLDPILTDLGLEKPADAVDRFKFFLGKPLVFISYLITIVWFGAALGEELLMRGFLLNKLSQIFGKSKIGWSLSVIIHAVIFGMLHNYQGLAGIIITGFVAIIFGIIYLVGKRKLFPVILAHVLINTITLTAFFLTDGQIN